LPGINIDIANHRVSIFFSWKALLMKIKFRISEKFPATPETLFEAWLNSEPHSSMTGGKAQVSDQAGGVFTAWDGYIKGKNLELQPSMRILQSWRTTEFQVKDPDSLLEITFIPEGNDTRVTIRHSDLPEHGMQYQQGWVDSYFTPMKEYFREK
jgi:uncharacterized protein YndB with AHSA1/START domain